MSKYPTLPLHRRERRNASAILVAVVPHEVTLPPGCEVQLRRLHTGQLDSPEFVLTFVPPQRVKGAP